MTQFSIKSLLCCSAAVVLTACGGNIDAGGEQLSATAAGVTTDAGAASAPGIAAPAAAVEAVDAIAEAAPTAKAEAAPAANTEAAPAARTAGATAQAADVTTAAFELAGYDSTPPQARAGQQDASIKQ
ncbi:hypothetical protein [Massilia sp. LjRoot122]|uniref:hypothetical protein n=1 Tax=Massilia sp. LjRoot122 TaxID=3342257 RepID=UPI003ED00796